MNQVHSISQEEITRRADQFEMEPVENLLYWALDVFGNDLVLACSCGPEDLVILDMFTKVNKSPRVFFLDTDKHFEETYETKERLERKYGLTFIEAKSELSLDEQTAKYGESLWRENPDLCCQLRKVSPLKKILQAYQAWMTGIRREQSPTRVNAKMVEWDDRFSLIKINPLVKWTKAEVWNYIHAYDLPYNPLHDQHYPSIGCSVCTRPVLPGEDERSGRWSGHKKTECGLHEG